MPLETATYISDLVASNPAHSDGLNQADAHARLIKSALKTTFPNITGAVTASHTQLNSLLSQLLGTTVYTAPVGAVGAPAYSFLGDLDSGWYSPAANRAALSLGGADALNFATDKTATFAAGASFAGAVAVTGAVSATGAITGPGTIPIGGMIMWTTDVLPTGAGVWAWANGGTLSRTTPGSGKELFDRYTTDFGSGTFYGVGNGTTTFNVINMQEVSPVGKTGMGGAASPGLLASITAGLRNVLNGLFGADTTTLVTGNLPPYTPAGTIASTVNTDANGSLKLMIANNTTGPLGYGGTASGANVSAANIAITSAFTGTAQGGTSTPANNVQPGRAVNFIIRIA